MSDVRKMTNEGLLRGVRGCFIDHGFICLPDELEELARRIGIMEEYCESDQECREKDFRILPWERKKRAEVAYRAMKGEQNANQ